MEPTEVCFVDFLHTELFTPFNKLFVLTDSNTARHCLPEIEKKHPVVSIEILAGEEHKNIESALKIWSVLTEHYADKNSLLVNVGGGMICDLGGFCASTYKRGLPFVQVPTSLLAMVDAAHGGKTGIDFLGYKNLIGTFASSKKIFIYQKFLKTLPERQLKSGFAEAIKHFIIADAFMFHEFWKNKLTVHDFVASDDLLRSTIRIKQSIVQRDPYEKGYRKILNFGHTVGHGLESYFLKSPRPLLHGEAIALGMVIETMIAKALEIIQPADAQKIEDLLVHIFTERPRIHNISLVLEMIRQDKKSLSAVPLFSLPNRIGNCLFHCEVSEQLITQTLQLYNEQYSNIEN
jgi:3-dehydroquinate synthase